MILLGIVGLVFIATNVLRYAARAAVAADLRAIRQRRERVAFRKYAMPTLDGCVKRRHCGLKEAV